MVRILRAFAWLRWRMLINSLEKTGARDRLERFSIAMERLGPIMAGVIMIPSTIVLAIVAIAGGYGVGRGDQPSMLFEAVRYILFFAPIASIVGPLFLPAADRTNPVRLLLLPIPRRTLYAAQAATTLGDVWTVLILPIVLFVPVGLAAAGAFGSAVVALAGGILLLAVVVGLSTLTTSLLHLIARDRRRGELLALLFILIIPAVSMLPGLLNAERHARKATRRGPAPEEVHLPAWAVKTATTVYALYPTELYVRSTRATAANDARTTATRVAALGATAAAIHVLGLFVFARVLESPGASGGRRTAATREAWGRTLPGLTPGASAVALAQLRLALRTPRGRSILLSPLVMMGVFAAVILRRPGGFDVGGIAVNGGLGFAAFTSFICLVATLPIVMNQFAVDKAGMTLALLSPLSDREYLTGKAIGNALIAFPPAVICLLSAVAIFRSGSPALWAAVPLSLIATYLLISAPAAMLSALFPRLVDLNSIGRGSNAHGLAGLLGMLSFVVAGGSNLLIILAATMWLKRPALVPVLLLAWCVIAFIVSRLLFVIARRIFAARRENLALLLSDR
jgi:hypothetical protein